jgi:hypothetical protein
VLSWSIPPLLTMLQPGPLLVVHGPGGEPPAELEMTFIESPVAAAARRRVVVRKGKHLASHDGCRLPLSRCDTRIQMSKPGLQECLPYIGSYLACSLHY